MLIALRSSLFTCLLIPVLCFADAGFQLPETMSNVMLVVNANDTLDSDDDGIPAWRELKAVVDSIASVLGQSCYTCSLKTRYSVNDLWHPQSAILDYMSPFLDTNRIWVPYTGVSGAILAGDDYILPKLATCSRAAAALTGVTPKYFCFGPGIPRWVKENSDEPRDSDPNDDPYPSGTDYDSVIAKSMCDFVEIYYRPDCDTVFETDVSYAGYWGSRYIEAARGASQKGFTPGVYRQYKANGGEASDSTLQYVICTQIDGFDDNDICNMMRKAYAGRYAAWEPDGTPNYWAVVDMQKPDVFNEFVGISHYFSPFYSKSVGDYLTEPYVTNSRLWHDAEVAFGSDVLCDLFVDLIDTSDSPDDTISAVVGGDPDTCTVYFGYSGARTLSVGDSAVFYFTAASYHDGGSPIPTSIAYETSLNLKAGAVMFTPESWNAYTIRDTTFRTGTSDDQTLMVEWFDDNGMNATYGIGNTREVTGGGTAASESYILDAMLSPEVPFAVASELATVKKAQNIAMGWPSFAWRQAEQAVGSSASFAGSCDEIFTYSATSPADADSYLVVLEYDNDSTSTVRANTSPSSAVSYSIGTRWISKGLSSVTIVYKDEDGNFHPEPVFQP